MDKRTVTPLEPWIAGKIGNTSKRITRDQIASYQLEMLNATINRALRFSSYYRRLLVRCGLKEISRLEDFTEYPLTAADDIRQHASQMVCISQSYISRVVTLATSGTTGSPKRLYFTQSDQDLTVDFFRCGISSFAAEGDKMLILLPGEISGSVGHLIVRALQRLNVVPLPYGFAEKASQAVAIMCREQATCLVGVPVQVLAMARYWQRWGKSDWKPKNILLSTDHVPDVIVRELKRIWGCEVYAHYGMTEMGLGGGIECAFHEGYHLREADLYFEIIDPVSLRPVPDGEYGEVVFTTLTRQGMPLIRYRTGDISRFIPEPCPCGSQLRRLESIKSRKDGRVYFGSTHSITMADLDEKLFALPEVIDFKAEAIYGRVPVLKLTITIMPDVFGFDKDKVLQALRQLQPIRMAEQGESLFIIVEVIRQWSLAPGKRAISIVDAAEGDRSGALE